MKDHSIVFSRIWLLQWIIGGHRLLISTSFVCRRRYARAGSFNGFNGFSRFNGLSSVLIVPMVLVGFWPMLIVPLVSLVSKSGQAGNSIAVAKNHQALPASRTDFVDQ